MHWRTGSQGFDHLNLGMVLKRLGGKVGLGSRSSSTGSQYTFRIFLLIFGVAGLTTTLLIGSFLWGYVSKKNKKEGDKLAPFEDLYPHASHRPNTVLNLHDFSRPSPSLVSYFTHQDSDSPQFDAKQDYAQVLAEARSHAAATRVSPVTNPPMKHGSKQTWMIRSSSARRHSLLEDLERAFPHHQGSQFKDRSTFSKSWKKLLFWKRSKKSNAFEIDTSCGIHSSYATPLHHALKSSRTRATVAPTTPTSGFSRKPIPKRSTSGPIYSDGSPYVPNTNTRTSSGPLSGPSTPARDGMYESAYMPLKKSGGSAKKSSSGPLYVP